MQWNRRSLMVMTVAALVISLLAFAGCKGKTGSAGSTVGTISGVVTTATGTVPLEGVSVTASNVTGTVATDSTGAYSMNLPAGSYTVTFEAANYTTGTASANVAVGLTTPLNVSMAEAKTGAPTVTVTASGQNVGYSTDFTVTANATDPNGDTISYVWTNATGTGATATGTTDSLTKALGGTAAPSSDPGGYITAFTQQTRLEVLPITPDTRGAKSVTVKADDGKGQITSVSVSVYAAGIQSGMKTVAIGVPVYLNSGSTSSTNTWTVTPPTGSTVAATLPAGRNPMFVPDVAGKYTITTTITPTVYSMDVYAGKWVGVITGGSYTTKTVSGVSYTNYPLVSSDASCLVCHDDATAPNKFTPWQNTGHANFFATGLEGITSNSGTCTPCHLVGYDASAAAANDGFDDMAAAEGFTYAKKTGAWLDMVTNYPLSARRTGIQCENCHGPQDTATGGAHTTTNSNPTSTSAYRIGLGSEVCGQCHSSGTGHHIYSEWAASKHARKDRLASKLTSNPNTSCVRCHTAQGAIQHMDQILTSGNAGPSPAVNYDITTVEPITCSVCHDPHSVANEFQLRVYNDVPTSMAGFGVKGFGTGAICAICHNVRNGNQCADGLTSTYTCSNNNLSNTTFLHEDSDAYAMTLIDRPHDAAQAELVAGRNAFFFGDDELPWLSKHSSVKDVCAGCHMKLNPQTHLSHGAAEPNSHRFAIQSADADTVCANCHSANVSAEGLKANVEGLVEEAGDNMVTVLKNAIVSALTTSTGGPTGTIYVNKKSVAFNSATTPMSFAGEARFFIGSATDTAYRGRLEQITWDAAGLVPIFTPANLAGTSGNADQDARVQVLRKSAWNVYLIEIDASGGVHNPSFALAILNRTNAALLGAPTAP